MLKSNYENDHQCDPLRKRKQKKREETVCVCVYIYTRRKNLHSCEFITHIKFDKFLKTHRLRLVNRLFCYQR